MSSILDYVFRFSLLFCQVEVVLPILILGYIWINKRVFMHGIFIVLFGMMLNSALKMTLQVPLPPALGIVEGYAFPSGHMQVAVVLYGWLYVCFDHKFFRMFVAVLLPMTAAGLVYFGYHYFSDTVGAFVVGCLLIALYSMVSQRVTTVFLFLILLLLSTSLVLYCEWIYKIYPHVLSAYSMLLGFLGSEYVFGRRVPWPLKYNDKACKMLATVLCMSAIAVTFFLFSYLGVLKSVLIGVVGLYVPLFLFLSNHIILRHKVKT